MSKKFLTSIDLGASATIISLAPNTATGDPSGGKAGQIYFNTTSNELRFFNPATGGYQSVSSGASSTFTLGSTVINSGTTTSSVTALNLTSASLGNSWLGAASATSINGTSIPSNSTLATQTYADSASLSAYNAGVTYANSASLNAYNQGVTYANSASLNAYTLGQTYANSASLNAYNQGVTYANSASSTAYTLGQTYANSASLNAYNQGVTYANSASLSSFITASAWVAAKNYLTSESDTLATVTARGATTSQNIVLTSSSAATNTTTGALTVSGGVGIGGNLYVGGNLEVTGSGFFGGSAMNISASNLNVGDSLIYIATGNPSNIVDIGLVGHYNDGTYQHTGLVRDASDSKYKLFYNVVPEPTTTIDFTSASYSTLQVGAIEIVQPGGTVSGARVYATTIGNGSANTASVTHNFNTRDVTVNVYDASTYDTVEVDVTRASVNVVVITAAAPLTNNGYRVVVTG